MTSGRGRQLRDAGLSWGSLCEQEQAKLVHDASSFISQPLTFEGLVEVMRSLGHYWFEIVRLPVERLEPA
jgi:hypothetical protein